MKQIYKLLAPEDNEGFLRRLVVFVLKKKDLVNKLEK